MSESTPIFHQIYFWNTFFLFKPNLFSSLRVLHLSEQQQCAGYTEHFVRGEQRAIPEDGVLNIRIFLRAMHVYGWQLYTFINRHV